MIRPTTITVVPAAMPVDRIKSVRITNANVSQARPIAMEPAWTPVATTTIAVPVATPVRLVNRVRMGIVSVRPARSAATTAWTPVAIPTIVAPVAMSARLVNAAMGAAARMVNSATPAPVWAGSASAATEKE